MDVSLSLSSRVQIDEKGASVLMKTSQGLISAMMGQGCSLEAGLAFIHPVSCSFGPYIPCLNISSARSLPPLPRHTHVRPLRAPDEAK